jgi:hypothetical protein
MIAKPTSIDFPNNIYGLKHKMIQRGMRKGKLGGHKKHCPTGQIGRTIDLPGDKNHTLK